MGVYAKEKLEAFLGLIPSVHKGEEKRIRQSLESLLTAILSECGPDPETAIDGICGRKKVRFNITNYNYQLD